MPMLKKLKRKVSPVDLNKSSLKKSSTNSDIQKQMAELVSARNELDQLNESFFKNPKVAV